MEEKGEISCSLGLFKVLVSEEYRSSIVGSHGN